jgi:hypothetical protein
MKKMSEKKEMKKIMNQKGQVTIFIILALAILVVLILLFLNRGSLFVATQQQAPLDQIKACISDAAKEGIGKLGEQGGAINPDSYFMYNGSKVQYLCYAKEYYAYCVMQKPLIKNDFEKELAQYIKPRVIECIAAIKDSLVKQGYNVDYKTPDISAELVLNNVVINADNLSLKIKKSNTEEYKSIKTEMNSRLYDMLMITSWIINDEAHLGKSEPISYMINYPSLKIERKLQSDGSAIYILTDNDTNERFVFATRSAALPSGVTGN